MSMQNKDVRQTVFINHLLNVLVKQQHSHMYIIVQKVTAWYKYNTVEIKYILSSYCIVIFVIMDQ